jgi:hypothetical protein
MFDNLRDEYTNENKYEEPKSAQYQPAASTSSAPAPRRTTSKKRRPAKFLGMTGIQRFGISFMFMLTVMIMGILILLITNKLAI